MKSFLDAAYTSWDTMKLAKSLYVSDIPKIRERVPVGSAFKLTTDVHNRCYIVKYTNWATVIGNYPYHCLVEMYYDNGTSTVMIKRDVQYTELLTSFKHGTIPYVPMRNAFIERESEL